MGRVNRFCGAAGLLSPRFPLFLGGAIGRVFLDGFRGRVLDLAGLLDLADVLGRGLGR